MSQLFTSGGEGTENSPSALVLPMNIQGWSPLGLIGLISFQSKGFSGVFSCHVNSWYIIFIYIYLLSSMKNSFKKYILQPALLPMFFFFFLNIPGWFGLLLSINLKITLTFFIGSGTLDGIQCLLCKWTMSIHLSLPSPHTITLLLSTVPVCLVSQSCLTLCDPMDYSPSGSSVHRDSPGKNNGVGCHALLQGISPTQGSNPGLPNIASRSFTIWATREAHEYWNGEPIPSAGDLPDQDLNWGLLHYRQILYHQSYQRNSLSTVPLLECIQCL